MIKIYVGNVGSGKTAYAVREIILNKLVKKTYSNIKIEHKNNIMINNNIMFTNIEYNDKGDLQQQRLKLNLEYWKNIKQDINVVLDEAHTLFNSRRSMTKVNILLTDWVALIRRVLGSNPNSEGDLILITQLWYRLDNITRDMAHQIKYMTCYNRKTCLECNYSYVESSEDYEKLKTCPKCDSIKNKKFDFKIEVKVFNSVDKFSYYKDYNKKTWFKRYIVDDIENYFKFYNTLQWDNMLSDLY